jgi:taurine dioxygenase
VNTVVLDPVGAEVTGLSLTDLGSETVAQLRELLAAHGVLVMPGQSVDDREFVDFLRGFGDLSFTTGEAAAPGFPELNVVSKAGARRSAG